MIWWLAAVNLVTGAIYTTYGLMTIHDLRRHWQDRGPSHFGLAWVAMAFTCGPHHLDHALHVLQDGTVGWVDVLAVTTGLPAGVAFFLLRVEAMRGGQGDRLVGDGLGQILTPGVLGSAAVAAAVAGATALQQGAQFTLTVIPNLALVILYGLIAAVLAATQGHNRAARGRWSLSGISLTAVFATCAMMHGAWVIHVASGQYEVHGHLVAIDTLAVPAAAYFLWVVRRLYQGSLADWNEAAPAAERAPDARPIGHVVA